MALTEIRKLDDSVRKLIPRAQRGDADAFDELIRRCYQQTYRWALTQTGDRDDADDVTQEVLVRLHRKLGSYHGQSRFTTWLYRVTLNAAMELHRRGTRHLHLDIADAESLSGDQDESFGVDRSSASKAVRKAFEQLPAGQRQVFDLADLQGFTPKEIGEMLEMKPVTVRAHLSKARRAIRKRMLEQHPRLMEELSS